jgi:Polyketide cyclase / dehydrase and lipid transport
VSLDVTAEVHVDREPAAVAAFMTDPANDPQWIGGLREARLLGDPPVAVGSRVHRVAAFLGRRVEYVNEIVALDAHRLDMRSIQAPFPMRITYGFQPRPGGGTTVRNRVRGGRRGPLFALMAPLVRRNVQRDLERLKAILEAA